MSTSHSADCVNQRVEVRLTFKVPDGTDPDEFGERVLCAVESLANVSTDEDGDLVLIEPSTVQAGTRPPDTNDFVENFRYFATFRGPVDG